MKRFDVLHSQQIWARFNLEASGGCLPDCTVRTFECWLKHMVSAKGRVCSACTQACTPHLAAFT